MSCLSDSSGSYWTSTNFSLSLCLYAELNELAPRQSKITTAVRQWEEMGTHLWSGKTFFLSYLLHSPSQSNNSHWVLKQQTIFSKYLLLYTEGKINVLYIQIWNNVSKWWQNFQLSVNFNLVPHSSDIVCHGNNSMEFHGYQSRILDFTMHFSETSVGNLYYSESLFVH